ncbi:MAG: benzoate transporter [Firmicutes bacterium]|nr:benzoate transporter [Bacillota bacterium]
MYGFEKGPGFKNGLNSLAKDLNSNAITAGIVAAIFGLSAGVVHIGAGQAAGMTSSQIIAWVVSLFMINGLGGIIIPLYYKQPISVANSLPGAILFASLIPVFSLQEVLGAALVSGVIVLLLGITGTIKKVMQFLPVPIVLGMTGGVLLKFGLDMVSAISNAALPVLLMIAAYLLVSNYSKKFPGVLAAIIVGIVVMLFQGVDMSGIGVVVDYPRFVAPAFSWASIISFSIPFAIMVVGAENAQAIGVMMGQGYKVPINGMTIASGIGGIVSPLFGLHNTNIAGPMTAICASEDAGEKDKRWVSALIVGIIWVIAAPFYGTVVEFLQVVPGFFISVIVGLALIKVLVSCIGSSIGAATHTIGALFAFLIGASGVAFFNLGSPFWALVGGLVVSLILEREQFEFAADS